MSVGAHFSDGCIEIPFVIFLYTDQASVSGLEDTVHWAEEVFFSIPVRSRPGCHRMVKGMRKKRTAEDKPERSSLCRQVNVVTISAG